jgi:ligand-binding sensor domain-containing protein
MHKRAVLLGFFLGSIFVKEISSQELQWKSFTNVGTIRDIAIGGGRVWSGSNGGVLRLQTPSFDVSKITNTEGLSSNEVVAVEIDHHGAVWFAFFNGVLNRYWPDDDAWEVVEDYRDQVITDVVAFGDSLYIGLDFGVSLYSIAKREVKETYVNLGLSSGGNVQKIGANSIFINGLEIWVATDQGIAQSSLDLPNLQAPASWRQYTTSHGLPTNFINKVVVVDGVPYAATRRGVARLVNGSWENSGFEAVNVISGEVVSANAFFSQNTLVIFTDSGVYYLDPAGQWQLLGSTLGDGTALKTDAAGNVWIGRRNRGLARFDFETQTWVTYEINSPASNNFKGLALDSKGRLWCASQVAGVDMFDGQTWRNFNASNGITSNDQRVVIVDAQDRVWFGSWGGGISVFEENGGDFIITQFNHRDGSLAGFTGDPNFVLVNGLGLDQSGNIWALNREAITLQILVAFMTTGNRIYFSRNELTAANEPLFSPFVTALEIDAGGRVWIGTEGRGVKVLDHRNTLDNKNDDIVNQGLTVSGDNIFSDNITALKEDRDGVMWIGSDLGVNFWFNSVVRNQFGLINTNVNVIGVDARNRKWFGTPSGISVLDNDGVIRTNYTTGNSPLVSSNVIAFAFNETSGDVWIGTTNGLSLLRTPFTAPQPNLDLLSGYPNPFIIDDANARFVITNLAENSRVVIYNSSGARVRSFALQDIQGAQAFWNGRDENGDLVPSGIYVYLAFTESGLSATGKVAVIRL